METESRQPQGEDTPLLELRGLSKRYAGDRALDNASLVIHHRSTTALLGHSGAGKSTLAKCIVGLEQPDAGEILFHGSNVLAMDMNGWKTFRRQVQLVFQDSATSLNPRFTAAQIIDEPLRIQSRTPSKKSRPMALEMMERVGLSPDFAERLPLQFSGGQRQRLAIARALIQKPEVLIMDEVLTGLDLSIQAQILNLLIDLQAAGSLTYLFITHNIRVAAYLADSLAVMCCGQIVESGNAADVLWSPKGDHTRRLLASVPGQLFQPSGLGGAQCPI